MIEFDSIGLGYIRGSNNLFWSVFLVKLFQQLQYFVKFAKKPKKPKRYGFFLKNPKYEIFEKMPILMWNVAGSWTPLQYNYKPAIGY